MRQIHLSLLLVLFAVSGTAASDEPTIGGRVLAPGGNPLPDVRVELRSNPGPLGRAANLQERNESKPTAITRTDADGRFLLAAPHPGLWVVRVEAPGFVPLAARLTPLIEPIDLPDAQLIEDVGLTVRVEGAEGPLEGALILARDDRSRPVFGSTGSWETPLRSGFTAADGTLRIANGRRSAVTLSVSGPGGAWVERNAVRGSAASVRLAAQWTHSLLVSDSAGKPLGDVLLTLGDATHPLGRTDAEGRAVLRTAGAAALTLRGPAGRTLTTRLEERGTTPDKPKDLVLPDRLSVVGRLIDGESRRTLPDGLVWDRTDPSRFAVTDAVGGFVLGGAPGTRLEITAGAPGYMRAESIEHQLSAEGRPGPSLVLWPAAAIEGRVLDSEDNPIPGAQLELEKRASGGMMRIEIGGPVAKTRAITDARGRYRLSPIDPEESWKVKASAEGFAPTERDLDPLEPRSTVRGVDLALQRGATLTGRIVDGEGRAIPAAEVALTRAADRHGGMMRIAGDESGAVFDGASDEEGRFEVSGLPTGRFDLEIRRRGFASRNVPAIAVDAPDEPVDLGELVLTPGVRAQGFVTDSDGLPVEAAEVRVQAARAPMMMMLGDSSSDEPSDAVSDATGWFAIDDLAPDAKIGLAFRRSGFVARTVQGIELPQMEPLTVKLEPASKVGGAVLDVEGEPIAGAEVNLRRSQTIEMGGNVMKTMMMTSETTDAEGRFLFEDQEPGRISLSAVASGFQEASRADLEIPKGEDLLGIDLPLQAGSILQGRALGPDGRAAIEASVSKVDEGDGMMRFGGTPTDGNGRFRLEGLAPGLVSIEATHPDYPRVARDVELEEGINTLDLQFEGGHSVSGMVSDTAGNPVPAATVWLAPAGRPWGGPETRSTASGRFEIPGVKDGDYRLWAEAKGYARSPGEVRVEVADGPLSDLQIQLDRGATIVGKVGGVDEKRFADVSVRADGAAANFFDTVGVDHEGGFRLENVPTGEYTVIATLADSARRAEAPVTLGQGELEARVELQFESGLVLSGRATQAGQPVRGASLFAEGLDIRRQGWTQTDNDGAFSIDGLEPGSYRVRLQDFSTGLTYDETIEMATSREIELEIPSAWVTGRVFDGDDRRPLSGVTLTLSTSDGSGSGFLPGHTATTDLDGNFRLDHVADGSWRLAAEKQGYTAVARELQVQSEKPVERLELEMQATEGLTLETRLPSGAPPDDVRVAVIDSNGAPLVYGNYSTGENGRVRLSSVPPGTWEVLVAAGGSAPATVRAEAGAAAVPVALPAACQLSLEVPQLKGSNTVATVRVESPSGVSYRSLSWDGRPRGEWPLYGGRLEFAALPPGTWLISVTAADGRTWTGGTELIAGQAATLELENQ